MAFRVTWGCLSIYFVHAHTYLWAPRVVYTTPILPNFLGAPGVDASFPEARGIIFDILSIREWGVLGLGVSCCNLWIVQA